MATETASPEPKRLTPEQNAWRWKILFSTYIAYAGYYLTRKVFTISQTSIVPRLHVSVSTIAHVWTSYLIAYAIGQFLNSFIGRKWGPRVILLGGLGISIVINVIFGFANSYWTLLSFMFFNGLVQATGWGGCVGTVASWLRRSEQGTFMGFWNTNFIVGNILVKTIGGFLLAATAGWLGGSWRYAFFGCTLIAFVIWWIIFFWQRDKPEDVGLEAIVEKESCESQAVAASLEEKITFRDYTKLLLNPVVPFMGLSYFFIKFLRYALDAWLPTFLNLQGLAVDKAAYYSQIFDIAGLFGAIAAGWALDRIFKGKWAPLCFTMGLGMVAGYMLVVKYGGNPILLAVCFGLVGFMLYGPDSILCGAAAMQVAGEQNTVAIASLVNGMGSIGAVIQEEVIAYLMRGHNMHQNIMKANLLTLGMSAAFVLMMIVVMIQVRAGQKRCEATLGKK